MVVGKGKKGNVSKASRQNMTCSEMGKPTNVFLYFRKASKDQERLKSNPGWNKRSKELDPLEPQLC